MKRITTVEFTEQGAAITPEDMLKTMQNKGTVSLGKMLTLTYSDGQKKYVQDPDTIAKILDKFTQTVEEMEIP